jgi:hypothetical protein
MDIAFLKIIHEEPGGDPRVHVHAHVLHTPPPVLYGDDARLRFYGVEEGVDALKRQ